MGKNLASQIRIPKLMIDMAMFEPHAQIAWRHYMVIPWAYDTPEEYQKRLDEITYKISEELFYWP